MSEPTVAVVVLNWNGWADTLACLDSLRAPVEQGLARVIVVDNASSDCSVARIREWLQAAGSGMSELTDQEVTSDPDRRAPRASQYTLIRSRRNGGYAAGNNLGITLALQTGMEYVFLLNNDATVEADCISRLIACAEQDPSIAIVGSTLVEDGGRLRIAGGARYNHLLTTSKTALASDGRRPQTIDYICGAAMFLRAEALREVGVLSEDYFLYFEELDLTRRVTGAGYRICWCPGSIVHHRRGRAAGSRSRANKEKSVTAEYHSNLSCLIFTQRFYPRVFWLAAPIRFVLKLTHHLLCLQPSLVVPLIRAYHDSLIRVKGTAV
jgi:GT2 family glycosyltransferase